MSTAQETPHAVQEATATPGTPEPSWDSWQARTARREVLTARGFTREEINAQMAADWSCATPPGTPPRKSRSEGERPARRAAVKPREWFDDDQVV